MTEVAGVRSESPELEQGLAALEQLARSERGLTLAELMETQELQEDIALRLTETMMERGYLVQDQKTKRLTLTRKLLSLANASVCQYNIIEESREIMRELRDVTTETVLLCAMHEDRGTVLAEVPALHSVRLAFDPGTHFDLHCSGGGKAMLANLRRTRGERILKRMKLCRHTARTITRKAALRKDLASVIELGYSADQGEGIEGVHSVGAPIFDHEKSVVGALVVTAPAARMPEESFPDVAWPTMLAASKISQRLGYEAMAASA